MKDFWGPAFKIVLTFIIAAAILNEIGALVWAQYQGNQIAKTIAETAATQYRASHSQPLAGSAAVSTGSARGVTVYGFQIKDGQLTVWIRVPPRRTPLVIVLEWLGQYSGTAKDWAQGLSGELSVDTNASAEVPNL